MENKYKLKLLSFDLSVCSLPSGSNISHWMATSKFLNIHSTEDELSVVCESHLVCGGIESNNGWKAFMLEGPLDFSLVGILSSLIAPLATAGISVFVISSFQTDYILVKKENLEGAISELSRFTEII